MLPATVRLSQIPKFLTQASWCLGLNIYHFWQSFGDINCFISQFQTLYLHESLIATLTYLFEIEKRLCRRLENIKEKHEDCSSCQLKLRFCKQIVKVSTAVISKTRWYCSLPCWLKVWFTDITFNSGEMKKVVFFTGSNFKDKCKTTTRCNTNQGHNPKSM